MDRIKFGPEGWNGIIARDFTVHNVVKIANAVGIWLNKRFKESKVVLGYDCRFGGEMFITACAKTLASKGIQVYLQEKEVASPILSLAVKELNAQCGIFIGAGNEPSEYNGVKLKGDHGGPLFERDIIDIENLISDEYTIDLELLNWDSFLDQGIIQYISLDTIYYKHVDQQFDIHIQAEKAQNVGIDLMYGSTQKMVKNLFPRGNFIRNEIIPTFKNISPEPLQKNLNELADYIVKKSYSMGIAFNGDGTRIAIVDENGTGYNSQQILILLIHYLTHYKQLEGAIALSYPVTEKAELIASQMGTNIIRTKAGFRHIAELMIKEEIIIGADESGGIGLGNNIPDKDGIWTMLTLLEVIKETKKSIKKLMQEVNKITGDFYYLRTLHQISRTQMNRLLEYLNSNQSINMGSLPILDISTTDGYRMQIDKYKWLMFYPSQLSGQTRIYAEAETVEELDELVLNFKNLVNSFSEK